MTKEEIHTSLDNMLKVEKSRSFLSHIVRSYIPVSKVVKVLDRPDNNFKCLIARCELFSASDIISGMDSEEFKKDFDEQLKSMFDKDIKIVSALKNLVGDRELGVTGKDTTTYMSYITYQEFYSWVMTKMLAGDKHINWLMKSIMYNEKKKSTKHKTKLQGNFKPKNVEIKLATYTLGDSSDLLSKLKSELQSKEK